MAFEKKTWVNVPDPDNYTGDTPLTDLPRFDAENMNRIEGGIEEVQELTETHTKEIAGLQEKADIWENMVKIPSYLVLAGNVNNNMTNAALGMNNEDYVVGVGKALALYARFKDPEIDIDTEFKELVKCNSLNDVNAEAVREIQGNLALYNLLNSNDYMYDKVIRNNIRSLIYRYQTQNLITGFTCAETYNHGSYLIGVEISEDTKSSSGLYFYYSKNFNIFAFCIGNDIFQTNGSKFLNFKITRPAEASTYHGVSYHHFGIVNEDGTDFIDGKYVDISTIGRKCIDISDLTSIRLGFKVFGDNGAHIFHVDDITLADFEIL